MMILSTSISLNCAQLINKSNDKISVTFLSPVEKGAPFWRDFESAMETAAKQFNVNLTIERLIYEEHNRFSVYDRYKEIVTSESKPDYFISFLQRNIEERSLTLFDNNGVNFISVNTGLSNKVLKASGYPQTTHPHWIGHISPNDYQAGKELMAVLAETFEQQHPERHTATLLAFTGPAQSDVSHERLDGLKSEVTLRNRSGNKIDFLQALNTPWRGITIGEKARALFQRHATPDIIWAASDLIAIDVIGQLPKAKKPLIGSFDWTTKGLKHVENGVITANMGGHFLDGAWAIVLAYDHANNTDLTPDENGIFNTPMHTITKDNISNYRQWINNESWRNIDYTKYSKTKSTAIQESGYKFRLPNISPLESTTK